MRTLGQLICGGLLLLVLYLNTKLFYEPQPAPEGAYPLNQEVVSQLQFLRGEIHQGAGAEMQELYPEGFVYLNALYALAWIELLPHTAPGSALQQEARTEAQWALRELQAPAAQLTFDADLPLPLGAFYQGWSAYCAGRYLAALPPSQRDSAELGRFRRQCALIAGALSSSSSPYLESYAGAAWPADGVMGAAALAWHDRLQPPQYGSLLKEWMRKVRQQLDAQSLIPHSVQATTGLVQEPARGSSQSQLLNFLVEIDSTFAHQQFRQYSRLFLTRRLGLPGVQESAIGAPPTEGIDSGPVIWGVGGAASLVGRRTMQRFQDTTTAVGLRNSIEAFGLPWHGTAGKFYLGGQLPIADAFIAWSNSLEPHKPLHAAFGWRTAFQLLSAAVMALLLVPLWFTRRRQ